MNYYSVIVDVISTLIGAFLGFLFALWIYRIGEHNAKRKKDIADKQVAYNSLKRFSILLKSVVSTCRQQNLAFDRYSIDLKERPIDNNLTLERIVTNDRDRLTKADCSDLYLSFMLFEQKSPNRHMDYRNIFNYADFIDVIYTSAFLEDQKHTDKTLTDLLIVKDNLLNIFLKMDSIKRGIRLRESESYLSNEEYIFADKYSSIYQEIKKKGGTDFQPYQSTYLEPLLLGVHKNITEQENINQLLQDIGSSLTRLKTIEMNSIHFSNVFAKVKEDVKIGNALVYFENIIDKIEKINEP